MNKRDCVHGHQARRCDLCDYEKLQGIVDNIVNAVRDDVPYEEQWDATRAALAAYDDWCRG